MLEPVRLRRFSGDDRYAVVSVEAASTPGTWMVRVARGASAAQLTGGTVYGPYPEAGLEQPFQLAIDGLKQEGFTEMIPGWSQFERLQSGDPTERCRGAMRLAWRKRTEAVEPILKAAQAALDAKRGEVCTLVDALGLLGDERAIPIARQLAERKNLSRRRSGVEALRNLGDLDGLASARQRGFERLPPPMQTALSAIDESDESSDAVKQLVDAAATCDPRRAGMIADVLYEAASPVTVAAARRILAKAKIGRPHIWRYAKSVLKRAILRRDGKTFGFLAHAVEHESKTSKGVQANVKSGLDGKKKSMRIFSPKAQEWVKRACWRFLRDIAHYEPQKYAAIAAEVLVHYSSADMKPPKGLVGAYGHCYLLGRILWGKSQRYRLRGVRWRYRSFSAVNAPVTGREEAFPALWDAGREAYLRVLGGAKLPEVFEFGLAGLQRHPTILAHASVRQLVRLLDVREDLAQGTPLLKLVVGELEKRFTVDEPDFGILRRLLMSPVSRRPEVRSLLRSWLTKTATLWTRQEEFVFTFTFAVDAGVRNEVAKLLVDAFRAQEALRKEFAPGFLAILQKEEKEAGQHAAFAKVARESLVAELGALLDLDQLLTWLDEGSMSGRAVAGALVGARPDAVAALGLARIVAMANDEVAAVREAAQGILRMAIGSLREDPSPLYALAESDWPDTRDVAFSLLRNEIDLARLGINGLIGLCDSNDPEVEELGRELIVRHFEELDAEDVLYRLSEHPSQAMQTFALGLMHVHLRGGYVPMARLERYFRSVLLDTWPSRRLKYGVIELLLSRGMDDERQAEFAAALFDLVLRTNTKSDFDRVAFALACLQTKFASVTSDLKFAEPKFAEPGAAE
ncbi:MAG: HEAT repeat domain-containing protein [Myxococcota bacterium]